MVCHTLPATMSETDFNFEQAQKINIRINVSKKFHSHDDVKQICTDRLTCFPTITIICLSKWHNIVCKIFGLTLHENQQLSMNTMKYSLSSRHWFQPFELNEIIYWTLLNSMKKIAWRWTVYFTICFPLVEAWAERNLWWRHTKVLKNLWCHQTKGHNTA